MTANTHRYTVSGRGAFPFDMLRYDRAWPASEQDSGEVEATTRRTDFSRKSPERTIRIEGLKPPTEGRWESFGWKVIV